MPAPPAPSLQALATALAASRVAFGAGMVLAPALAGRLWIGGGASDDRAQVLGRAMGIRDLALGTAALLALRSADEARVREWFAVQTATDTVDLLATLAAGGRMPGPGRAFTASVAAGSVAIAAATARDPRAALSAPASS